MLAGRKVRGSVETVVWSGRFQVQHRLAERYRSGRVFLARDAAHVHSPAGGQGMNTGIQDAVMLADTIALGHDPDSYERVRRPVAQDVLAMTDRMTRAATLQNPTARLARNTALLVAGRLPVARRRAADRGRLRAC